MRELLFSCSQFFLYISSPYKSRNRLSGSDIFMYTYFTKKQAIEFAQSLLSAHGIDARVDSESMDIWAMANPEVFQPHLPPIFGLRQPVDFVIGDRWTPSKVMRVHIHEGGNSYDLELELPDGGKERVYNVSPSMIARDHWKKENITDSKIKE